MLRSISAIAVCLQGVYALKMFENEIPAGFERLMVESEAASAAALPVPPQTILFLVQEESHLEPVIPYIQELCDNGHELILFTAADDYARKKLGQRVGVIPRKTPSPRAGEIQSDMYSRYLGVPSHKGQSDSMGVGIKWYSENWEDLLKMVRLMKPDAIVYDMYTDGMGKFLAEAIGARHISLNPLGTQFHSGITAMQPSSPPGPVVKAASAKLSNIVRRKAWNSAPPALNDAAGVSTPLGNGDLAPIAHWVVTSPSAVVFSTKEMEGKDVTEQTDSTVVFAGRQNSPEQVELRIPGGRKVVVDLGPDTFDAPTFFLLIAEALSNEDDLAVVLNTRDSYAMDSLKAFRNVVTLSAEDALTFAQVMSLLNEGDVLVTSGSSQAVLNAVKQRARVLVCPRFPEHFSNAQKVEERKVGKRASDWFGKLWKDDEWESIDMSRTEFLQEIVEGMKKDVSDLLSDEEITNKAPEVYDSFYNIKVYDDVVMLILGQRAADAEKTKNEDTFFLTATLVSSLTFLLFTVPSVVVLSK